MTKLFTLLFFLGAFNAFSQISVTTTTPPDQQGNPTTNPSPKDSIIYVEPTGELFDTILVYAVLATLKQPLSLQPYVVITKYYTYSDSTKKQTDQWIEKEVTVGTGASKRTEGIRVKNHQNRILYIIRRTDFKE